LRELFIFRGKVMIHSARIAAMTDFHVSPFGSDWQYRLPRGKHA